MSSAKTAAGAGEPPLETWIVASLALLRAGGRFVMIHRPDALAQILAAFGRRLGVDRDPAGPSAGGARPPIASSIAGVKGARGPISLRPASSSTIRQAPSRRWRRRSIAARP